MDISLTNTVKSDLDFVSKLENAPHNSKYIIVWNNNKHEQVIDDPNSLHLLIEDNNNKLGYMILVGLNDINNSLEFKRIVIDKKGQGVGRKAIQLLKDKIFNNYPINRIWLDVKEYNTRAKKLYESEGFVVEGLKRECYKYEDKYESLYLMSILRSEYFKSLCSLIMK